MNHQILSFNSTCSHIHLTSKYSIVSAMSLILSTISLVIHMTFMSVVTKCHGQLPLNVKLLMIHCTLAGGIKSFCLLIKSFYNFALLGFVSGVVIERKVCIGLELPYAISMNALVLSMMFIGIERLWATFKQNNLTHHEAVGWHVILAQSLIWIISMATFLSITTTDDAHMPKRSCYCFYMMLCSPLASSINRFLFIVALSLVILINCLVHWKNKRQLFDFTLNTARYSLSRRFIMWSNVKATRMLLPTSIIHAISYSVIIVFMMFQSPDFKSGMTSDSLTNMVAVQCLLLVDAMIHPVFCLFCSNELKIIFWNTFPVMAKLLRRNGAVADQSQQQTVTGDLKSNGTKVIVQYRVNPEMQQDLLQQMWDKERINSLKSTKY